MSVPKRLGHRGPIDANDRRLKLVYECLDNGDNKKALQEADRVLKKSKQLNCAKALKSLALIRMGRKAEAQVLIKEIRKVDLLDENILQALTACYKELPEFEQIAKMYEQSLTQHPNDEMTLTQLFNAYVRVGDYTNQQQIALKLYKLFPNKTPYLFWVIVSYVMMSDRDIQTGKKVYLPLAEQMTNKYLKEVKFESEPEIMVYMSILEKQEKYKELLNALGGPYGDRLTQNLKYKILLRLKSLIQLKDWNELNISYKKLLVQNLDDFTWFRDYLKYALMFVDKSKSSFEDLPLVKCSNSQTVNGVTKVEDLNFVADETLESISLFLITCIELSARDKNNSLRGPYLAQLQFVTMIKEQSSISWSEYLGPRYLTLLSNYFNLFGDKPCCFSDLKMFLDVLSLDERVKLRALFEEQLPRDCDGAFALPENLKSMQRHIFVQQSNLYMEMYEGLPIEDLLKFIEELKKFYRHGLPFGSNLTMTDVQPADPYALMIAEVFYGIARKEDSFIYLISGISILEEAFSHSPSNFHVKLLLIKCYTLLGCPSQTYRYFELLEVKHIQNDTLGYVVCNPLLRFGQLKMSRKFIEGALKFYEGVQREMTDFIINCYKYGSFDKVPEFIELKKKLTRSVQLANAFVNKLLIGLFTALTDQKAMDELIQSTSLNEIGFCDISCDMLTDNRDFRVVSDWRMYGRQEEQFQEKSFFEEKMWLLLQASMLRFMWHVSNTSYKKNATDASNLNNNANHDETFEESSVVSESENRVSRPDSGPQHISETRPNEAAKIVPSTPTSVRDRNSTNASKKLQSNVENSNYNEEIENVIKYLESCSLFKNNCDHVSDLLQTSFRVRKCMESKESTDDYFFGGSLRMFIDMKLDRSFNQFAMFFSSVIDVVNDPKNDKNVATINDRDGVIVLECSKSLFKSDEKDFSLTIFKQLEQAILLVQHLSQLVIILGHCDQLLQPFLGKKSKKKSKKQNEVSNILVNFKALTSGVFSVCTTLQGFFKKNEETKFALNLSKAVDHLTQENDHDSVKVTKKILECQNQSNRDMYDFLHQVSTRLERLREKDVDNFA